MPRRRTLRLPSALRRPLRPPRALALACATALAVSCSAVNSASPEQRLAERLRNSTWEGTAASLDDVMHGNLQAMRSHPSHAGERLEFRDTTVTFSRYGATLEAVYAVADSTHLRVRRLGSAAGQTVVVTLVGSAAGDTLRLVPNPFPAGGSDAAAVGEWARTVGPTAPGAAGR